DVYRCDVGALCWLLVRVFFFFQAEDGIRDRNVTGVQTCALPISRCGPASVRPASCSNRGRAASCDPMIEGLMFGSKVSSGASGQIGRASCRERGERSEGGGA